MADFETHAFDVVVVGAGGAGLRAAIEAARQGARTAVVCKSLLGKAHTVMAEGGIAAALGNVYPEDNWQVHFRDTMRGGKLLSNWRMAQIHAQEAPERVLELEEWGALFDRTPDGRILQRDFGGHRFARLAHVGDRTGLEMIRMLQHRATEAEIAVFMECTITRLLKDGDRIAGAFGYWRESGRFVVFEAPAVVLATGGIGKAYKVTSNSWEYTGDGHALALWAGADLIDMEFVQFHPTGMVWPPSVRGILVTEGVRGDGGVLRNSDGERFMFRYIPEMFRAETADTEEEADRWYDDKTRPAHPRPPAPRRGGPGDQRRDQGGPRQPARRRVPRHRHPPRRGRTSCAGCPACTTSSASWPTSTSPRSRWRSGPTCHYMMGGVRVDAETQASTVPGLFAAGEVAAGLHGANRLGGNSLSDLLVFGRRAGLHAAEYAGGRRGAADRRRRASSKSSPPGACARSTPPAARTPTRSSRTSRTACRPWSASSAPTTSWPRRSRSSASLRERAARVRVEGHRQYNPGWHLALDLDPLLAVSECITRAALERTESRGAQTREDFPGTDPELAKVNIVVRQRDGELSLTREPLPPMPADLRRCWRRADGSATVTMRIWRGDAGGGEFRDYEVAAEEGEVVLDVLHRVQASQAGDLAAALELQGRPVRLVQRRDQRPSPADVHDPDEPAAARTSRSRWRRWAGSRSSATSSPTCRSTTRWPSRCRRSRPGPRTPDGTYRMQQADIDRVQEFHNCIECFLCQNVCHVIRDHDENKRGLRRAADVHPLRRARDASARHQRPPRAAADPHGLGMCNITKCCTEVCPERIHITDNAIIPLKERVVDDRYDPIVWLGRKFRRRRPARREPPGAAAR